jgi:hypothetical protein
LTPSLLYKSLGVSEATRIFTWTLLLGRLSDHFFFLKSYYRLNNLLWQDGFLLDFLQKKVTDKWIRTFVIYSGHFFSERFLFDLVVRFYIDFVVWPAYDAALYEFNSISSTLVVTVFLFLNFTIAVSTYYLLLIL